MFNPAELGQDTSDLARLNPTCMSMKLVLELMAGCVGVSLCTLGWVKEDVENRVFGVTAYSHPCQNKLNLPERGGPTGCMAAHH